jgi:hypothetical protein
MSHETKELTVGRIRVVMLRGFVDVHGSVLRVHSLRGIDGGAVWFVKGEKRPCGSRGIGGARPVTSARQFRKGVLGVLGLLGLGDDIWVLVCHAVLVLVALALIVRRCLSGTGPTRAASTLGGIRL